MIKPKCSYAKRDLPKEPTSKCDLPAITCTSDNQGISCYVPRQNAEILKNVISVAANGDAPAFYQLNEFTILQDAYALKFTEKELNSSCYLYLTSLLQKILQKYNWNNKSGWTKVSQEFIYLPTYPNNKIAFDFMESFIKALEKGSIKSVVEFSEMKLNAYKK